MEKIETLLTVAHFYVFDPLSEPYIEQLDVLLSEHPELVLQQAHLLFLKACKDRMVGNWGGSTEKLEQILDTYRECGEVRGQFEVMSSLAVIRAMSVGYSEGLALLEQCRQLVNQHALPPICYAYMLSQFAVTHIIVELYDLAESYAIESHTCAFNLSLRSEGVISKNVVRAQLTATWVLAYTMLTLERFDEAIQLVEPKLPFVQSLNSSYWEVQFTQIIAHGLIETNHSDVAIERLLNILDTILPEPQIPSTHYHCYALLGVAYARVRRFDEAEPILINSLKLYDDAGDTGRIYLSCLRSLSDIAKQDCRYEEAFSYLDRIAQLLTEDRRRKYDLKLAHLTEVHQYEMKRKEADMLRESNDKLTEANYLLQQAYDEQSELVKIVSHDIYSPLSSIGLGTEMTKQYMRAERIDKAMDTLTTIRQSADYITVIVDQLRTVDKLDQGEMNIEWRTMSLRRMIFSAVERNRPVATAKQIEVTFNCQRRLSVHVDEVAMMQVLDNILSNGIKYSYPNSVIQINAIQREDVVEILFTDQGVGIDHSDIHKLFSKFGRLDRSRPTSNERSTGLGLYIVKKFVHAMNGDVVACSDGLGTGTTFMIQLPLSRSTPVYQQPVPAAA